MIRRLLEVTENERSKFAAALTIQMMPEYTFTASEFALILMFPPRCQFDIGGRSEVPSHCGIGPRSVPFSVLGRLP